MFVNRWCFTTGLLHSSIRASSREYKGRNTLFFFRATEQAFVLWLFSCSFVAAFNGPTTSHKVGKLQERTEYQFRIQASNDAGPGPFSDVVSFVTTAQPPNTVKG